MLQTFLCAACAVFLTSYQQTALCVMYDMVKGSCYHTLFTRLKFFACPGCNLWACVRMARGKRMPASRSHSAARHLRGSCWHQSCPPHHSRRLPHDASQISTSRSRPAFRRCEVVAARALYAN